ncbi:complement component C1q receptor [Kryptolebias marmoratus]|uniref:Thrombomodulin n=1 Tax=Kryptolebias marmoratus TaxID=37003 RepID=A0A3Q3AC43_KRYMA|nr:complement component C1q receptor [Kryptolebias marmoratus]
MYVLVLILVLLFFEPGFGLKRTSSCLPVCSGEDCITVNQKRVDFQSAEEACRSRNGELLTLQSETHQRIFDDLSKKLSGSFWIGLRLPAGSCSDLSAPLRGYEWTSGNRTFTPSHVRWTDNLKLCFPCCVSLSNNQEWKESLCSDKTNGFLCRTKQQHACQEKERIFKKTDGCKSGPCEHQCSSVKEGYKCSCFSGYKPDREDPRRCRLFCGQETCPAVCESRDQCSCPDGFVLGEQTCEDIDECDMDQCEHSCLNSFGGFMCFCLDGFVLVDHVKCVPAAAAEGFFITTPAVEFVKNGTLRRSAGTEWVFLWIWVVVAVTLVLSVFLIRFQVVKRQKRREQTQQAAAAPVDNVEF